MQGTSQIRQVDCTPSRLVRAAGPGYHRLMTSNPTAVAKPDFRSRVAEGRRDRMRARLLAATMKVCGGANRGRAVIDDVVREAGVSRGAFYRYYPSLEAAIAELIDQLVAELVDAARMTFSDVDDPVLGSAIGSQLLLGRASGDREWATFVSSSSQVLDTPPLRAVLHDTIGAGGKTGVFDFPSLDVATDLFAGGLLGGIRRLASDQAAGDGYVVDLSLQLLRGLGTTPERAAAAAREGASRIAATASRLPWAR